MNLLIVLLILLILCGSGGAFYVGQPHIGGSFLGLLLIILLILALTGNLR